MEVCGGVANAALSMWRKDIEYGTVGQRRAGRRIERDSILLASRG